MRVITGGKLSEPTRLVLPTPILEQLAERAASVVRPKLTERTMLVLDAGDKRHSVVLWRLDRTALDAMHLDFNRILQGTGEMSVAAYIALQSMRDITKRMNRGDKSGIVFHIPDGQEVKIESDRIVVGRDELIETTLTRTGRKIADEVSKRFGIKSWKPHAVMRGTWLIGSEEGVRVILDEYRISSRFLVKSSTSGMLPDENGFAFVIFNCNSTVPTPDEVDMLLRMTGLAMEYGGRFTLLHCHGGEKGEIRIEGWRHNEQMFPGDSWREFIEARTALSTWDQVVRGVYSLPKQLVDSTFAEWTRLFGGLATKILERVPIFDETEQEVNTLPMDFGRSVE
jgi:hypothetical protein